MLDEVHGEGKEEQQTTGRRKWARPHLLLKAGELGKEERWDGLEGKNGRSQSWKRKKILVGAVFDASGSLMECGTLKLQGGQRCMDRVDGSANPKQNLEFLSTGDPEENQPTRDQTQFTKTLIYSPCVFLSRDRW